jgi:hypothetical protein
MMAVTFLGVWVFSLILWESNIFVSVLTQTPNFFERTGFVCFSNRYVLKVFLENLFSLRLLEYDFWQALQKYRIKFRRFPFLMTLYAPQNKHFFRHFYELV